VVKIKNAVKSTVWRTKINGALNANGKRRAVVLLNEIRLKTEYFKTQNKVIRFEKNK